MLHKPENQEHKNELQFDEKGKQTSGGQPFTDFYPKELNKFILSMLPYSNLQKIHDSKSAKISHQIFFKNTVRGLIPSAQNHLVVELNSIIKDITSVDKRVSHEEEKDASPLSIDHVGNRFYNYSSIHHYSRDLFRKALFAFYDKSSSLAERIELPKNINQASESKIDTSSSRTINVNKLSEKLIATLIYHLCVNDPDEAGKLLNEILIKYRTHQLEISKYFIKYGANINLSGKNHSLHVAVALDLPIHYFDCLLEHEVIYAAAMIETENYDYNVHKFIKNTWTPIMRAALSARGPGNYNDILCYLVKNFPKQVEEAMSNLSIFNLYHNHIHFAYKEKDFRLDSNENYNVTLLNSEIQEVRKKINEAVQHEYTLSNLFKTNLSITRDQFKHVEHVLIFELKTIHEPIDCFEKYSQLPKFKAEADKFTLINLLQEKVYHLFISDDFVAKFDSLYNYTEACVNALNQPLFALHQTVYKLVNKHEVDLQSEQQRYPSEPNKDALLCWFQKLTDRLEECRAELSPEPTTPSKSPRR